ncbi:FecR family protein [Flavobacterium seoulense]|uniref:Iron dicitrate transport regulator FecR n=1 Tax=Flavobacterium seoulense TaxID=1492738 RepID=A0A066WQG4_9FLAO|nr:FecR family protein [Flavobacterium seoulense]KDN54808.1 iron dicitrate transport regulator FecR [Flavobacterium seoulense]
MKERNQYIEIEDFLADESFRLWMKSGNDHDGWEEWTLEHPSRAKLVEEARLWLLAMKVSESNVSPDEVDAALQKTWMKIEKVEQERKMEQKIIQLWNTSWFKKVAAVLVIGLLSFYTYNNYFVEKGNSYYEQIIANTDDDGLLEQINNSNKPQIITLSDGSSVLLQPKSKLSYPKIFRGNERNVYLSGEAFFEISKNPKKPFFVHANEIVTKVVGTSFRIKAYAEQSDVEVLVRTGKVEVNSKKMNQKEMVLLPNQALRFERKNQTFDKITDITKDKSINNSVQSIEQLSFEFTDIPVAQIFKTIEQAYSVEIDFPKKELKNCHLTTSLSDQPLPEKLKIICKSISENSSYTMNGNQITILSKGCN